MKPPPTYEAGQLNEWGVPKENREALTASIFPSPRFKDAFTEALAVPPGIDVKKLYEAKSYYRSLQVSGFHVSNYVMSTPERDFLAIFGATKRLKAEDPIMPKPWAESLEEQIRAA